MGHYTDKKTHFYMFLSHFVRVLTHYGSNESNDSFGFFCMCCYLQFKLGYPRNLKFFSISIKELFEPIVLQRKADGFSLFLKAFS